MSSAQIRGPKKGDIAPIPFSFETNQLELLKSVLATYINGSSLFQRYTDKAIIYTFEFHNEATFEIVVADKSAHDLGDYLFDTKKEYIKNNNLSENTVVAKLTMSSPRHSIYLNEYIHDINYLPASVDKMIPEFNTRKDLYYGIPINQ